MLRSGWFELLFGCIDVNFGPATARWNDLALSGFTPADELHIMLGTLYLQIRSHETIPPLTEGGS